MVMGVFKSSGLRIGTPEVTRLGMKEEHMLVVAASNC